jgi:hypothetical protein
MKQLALSVVFGALLASAGVAQAGTIYTEVADAGDTIGTAQGVGGGVSQINGTLIRPADNADLYRLAFGSPGALTVTVTSWVSSDRSELFLFDAAGHGIICQQGYNTFTVSVSPGTYLLAFSSDLDQAVNNLGESWSPGGGGWTAGTTLDHFDNAGTEHGGAYSVTLSMDTVSAVPLPSAAWMGLGTLGVLGLLAWRRRRLAVGATI